MSAQAASREVIDGVEVLIEGHGRDTILLLHGWPDTHRLWDPQVAVLAPHYRCLRLTLPGFAPGTPKQAYSLAQVVATIARVIDHVSPDAPVTLLLHDWGCFFGYQYALAHPARVARVIGVDIGDAGSKRHLAELSATQKLAIVGYQLWLAAAWRAHGAAGDRMSRWMAKTARCPTAPESIHANMAWPYAVQWTGAAGGFKGVKLFTPACPMLFIYGERKPFMFHSRAWAEQIAAQPHSRAVALPTGHWVMVQRPDEFNAAVLEWLGATASLRG